MRVAKPLKQATRLRQIRRRKRSINTIQECDKWSRDYVQVAESEVDTASGDSMEYKMLVSVALVSQ